MICTFATEDCKSATNKPHADLGWVFEGAKGKFQMGAGDLFNRNQAVAVRRTVLGNFYDLLACRKFAADDS